MDKFVFRDLFLFAFAGNRELISGDLQIILLASRPGKSIQHLQRGFRLGTSSGGLMRPICVCHTL